MTRQLAARRAWASLPMCVVLCAVPDAGADPPAMLVHVHDSAHLEPGTLREAEEVVSHLFARAGIRIVLAGDGAGNPGEQPGASAVPWISVSIVSRELAAPMGLGSNVLGGAPGEEANPDRALAYVFDHVASRLAAKHPEIGKAEILGHAIAHEIGHLLLHTSRHSAAGLMRAQWKPEDIRAMPRGRLMFDAGQIARLRAEVLRRTRRKTTAKTWASPSVLPP